MSTTTIFLWDNVCCKTCSNCLHCGLAVLCVAEELHTKTVVAHWNCSLHIRYSKGSVLVTSVQGFLSCLYAHKIIFDPFPCSHGLHDNDHRSYIQYCTLLVTLVISPVFVKNEKICHETYNTWVYFIFLLLRSVHGSPKNKRATVWLSNNTYLLNSRNLVFHTTAGTDI